MPASRGFVRRLLTLLALLIAATGATALPRAAVADDAFCQDFLYEGDDVRTIGCQSWRSTWVLDVGRFNLVGYQDLWRYRAMFNQHGFVDNFLWYAPPSQRTFEPGRDSGVKWASCANEFGGVSNPYPDHEVRSANDGRATGLCTDRIVPAAQQRHVLLDDFKRHPVTLSIFGWGGAFIARECGNFSVPPADNPVPTISGTKYHDQNRNGRRDAGEPGLAGWQMKLVRDSSSLAPGQHTGDTGLTATTGPDGRYSFALWGQGPGTYRVVEVQQPGYVQTAAPAPVHVPFGAGSTHYDGNDLGNVEDRADVVKVDWDVVQPPQRMDASVAQTLTVRAVLTNAGPAPEVDVVDTMTARGQADCVIAPAQQAVTRRLRRGVPVTVDFEVTVTCDDPSFHTFVFDNVVRVTGGITDPDLGNNARTTDVTIPVFDDSDLRLTDAVLDCPPRTDVEVTFECTGSALVSNEGPYGATNADVTFAIAAPDDCTVTDGVTRTVEDTLLATTGAVPVSVSWAVTCANRSYHPISMTATVAVDHVHVEDHRAGNDTAGAADTVEVFEAADLRIEQPMRIACGGRLPSITTFGCDVRVTVTNAGPATAVVSETATTLTAPADCTVTPAATVVPATLDAGETRTLEYRFDVACADEVLHTLLARARIATAEPHAEDRDLSNNTARVRWVPTDVKPRSEPSSVNVGKEGVVPVSILSTREFDAFAEVDRTTLRWGATGFEDSLKSCGGTAEDTNGDGFADLVCRFDTTVAGLTCATEFAILIGVLKDGTPFESQDPVNTVGCRRT